MFTFGYETRSMIFYNQLRKKLLPFSVNTYELAFRGYGLVKQYC